MLKMICFCTERKADKSAEITAISAFKNIYPVFDFKGYKKSWHELLIMEGKCREVSILSDGTVCHLP